MVFMPDIHKPLNVGQRQDVARPTLASRVSRVIQPA